VTPRQVYGELVAEFAKLMFGILAVCGLISLAVQFCGCAATAPLEKAVRSGAEFATLAEPVLVEAYREQQKACLVALEESMKAECVAKVRAAWRPLLDAYDASRSAWCALDALANGDARCAP
jgi:predicted lipoprotein